VEKGEMGQLSSNRFLAAEILSKIQQSSGQEEIEGNSL